MTRIFTMLGFLGTIITIVLLNNITGYEIHSFTLWFILPFGALLVGAGSAAGMFYGHVRYNKPITAKHYLFGAILGIAALYGIQYGSYITTYVTPDNEINYWFNGDPISSYEIDGEPITFGKYLEITRQSSTHQFFYKGVPRGESYESGETANALSTWLQLLGAVLGGVCVGFVMLDGKKFCQECKKYTTDKWLFNCDIVEYEPMLSKLADAITNIPKLENLIKSTKTKEDKVKAYINVALQYCPDCFDGTLIVRVMRLGSNSSFEEVEKLRKVFSVTKEQARSMASIPSTNQKV